MWEERFLNIFHDVEQNDKEMENMKENLRDEGPIHSILI